MNPPWSACGSGMELLRSCYHASMRPYTDRPDIIVAGRWKWCPADAQVVPYEHAFGSHIWDCWGTNVDGVIGEQAAESYPYNLGASPVRAEGKRTCGTAADWAATAPYDAERVGDGALDPDGLPACCIEPIPPLPQGGCLIYPCGYFESDPDAPCEVRIRLIEPGGDWDGLTWIMYATTPETPNGFYTGIAPLSCGPTQCHLEPNHQINLPPYLIFDFTGWSVWEIGQVQFPSSCNPIAAAIFWWSDLNNFVGCGGNRPTLSGVIEPV